MVSAVPWHMMSGQTQFANAQRGSIFQPHARLQHRVSSESGASHLQCSLVAVRMIRMAVSINDVRDGERLRPGPFDEDLGRVRGIDEHRGPCFAVAEQVAEVAVAAGPNLFEDESHARDSYITVFRLYRSQLLSTVAGLLHFQPLECQSMTNFVVYVIGTLLVVAGLAYGASRMGVSQVWIIAGALVIIGIGFMGGIVKTRQKEPS